ncbi:MAG: hypothetical protein A3G34_11175 [Candidatus Lindowbacteria bacterium RIFCSPLOWO2_12_FULL_62_27]|nr:MAG: hypothetical protein A3G34_11175 [Candidatus Lindowbacteria bacterium RIFCSPLOWO2_12_FULL_62_27]OGH63457.1 MAG: hypothetical protein A3I06_06735 [Candidatus Lindowbacteria bacterium RIFCSPLOWO2_02_FULL_62_12]
MEANKLLDCLKPLLPPGSFLAGGAVRDMLLGVEPRDVDVLVPADPMVLGRTIAERLDGFFVPLDESRRIARVVLRGGDDVDLLPIPSGGVPESLAERDFTMNAIAQSLDTGALVDPFNGREDLKNKTIRHVAEKNLEDDPLRILRAWRFHATLGFSIDPALLAAIRQKHNRIWSVAPERIAEEWFIILAAPAAGRAVRAMADAGTLTALLPELLPMRGCTQNEFHHLDVFDHSLAAIDVVDDIAGRPERQFPPEAAPVVAEYLARTLVGRRPRVAYLRFAALLHDIEKPSARSVDPDGRVHFYGHEKTGRASASAICGKLRLARDESDLVARLVAQHMIFGPELFDATADRDRFFYRIFRDFGGDDGIGLLILSLADRMASLGPAVTGDFNESHRRLVVDGVVRYIQEKERVVPPKLLSGNDVMTALNLPPGPAVGVILERVRELQAEGKIRSRDDALRALPSLRP